MHIYVYFFTNYFFWTCRVALPSRFGVDTLGHLHAQSATARTRPPTGRLGIAASYSLDIIQAWPVPQHVKNDCSEKRKHATETDNCAPFASWGQTKGHGRLEIWIHPIKCQVPPRRAAASRHSLRSRRHCSVAGMVARGTQVRPEIFSKSQV